MIQYVSRAHAAGFQVSSHAIGTRAIETILTAFEHVLKGESDPKNPYRHRIDHFEFPTQDQVDRALALNLVITAQPGYAWMDEKYQQSYRKYLRPEQIARQIPLKTIMERGGILCGSSDSPIQHLNPFVQIHGMVNFPIVKEQLSVYQALRTYTYNAAYATFEDHQRGTLEVGKVADFMILEEDPFTIPAERLLELKPVSTYLGGKKFTPLQKGTLGFLLKGIFGGKKAL